MDGSIPHSHESSIQIVTDPVVSSQTLAEWVVERLDPDELEDVSELGPYRAFGVLKDGKAVCVVIFNQYRRMRHGGDMRVIIVSDSPSWCLPSVLRALFAYPFITCGCERLTAIIRDGNSRSFRFCKGLGFRKEGVLRRAHNGKTNAIVLSMLKHECTWLKGHESEAQEQWSNGQKINTFSASSAKPDRNNRRAVRRKQRRLERVSAN